MTEIITYSLSVTGLWQYTFCQEGEKYGSVISAVSLREPVRIQGPDIDWYSWFDIDREIVPGVSRQVMDNRTGEELYRIVWWRPDLYEVCTAEKSIQVEIRDGCYLFGVPLMPVSVMTERAVGEARFIEGREMECRFRTMFYDSVSAGYRMMALSFPALRFC